MAAAGIMIMGVREGRLLPGGGRAAATGRSSLLPGVPGIWPFSLKEGNAFVEIKVCFQNTKLQLRKNKRKSKKKTVKCG